MCLRVVLYLCAFSTKFWISSCKEHFDNIIFLFSFFLWCLCAWKLYRTPEYITFVCDQWMYAWVYSFAFGFQIWLYIHTHIHIAQHIHNSHTHAHSQTTHICTYRAHTCDTLYISFGRTVFSLFSSRLSASLLLSSRRLFFVSFEFCIYKQMLFIWNSIAQYKSMYTNVCEKNRDSERETESTFTMDFYTTKMHGKTAHSLCLRTYSRVVR